MHRILYKLNSNTQIRIKTAFGKMKNIEMG